MSVVARCLLCVAGYSCLLVVVVWCCSLCVVRCALFVARCLLFGVLFVCCVFVAYVSVVCMLRVACWLCCVRSYLSCSVWCVMCVVRRLHFVGCCSLPGVWCLAFVVC